MTPCPASILPAILHPSVAEWCTQFLLATNAPVHASRYGQPKSCPPSPCSHPSISIHCILVSKCQALTLLAVLHPVWEEWCRASTPANAPVCTPRDASGDIKAKLKCITLISIAAVEPYQILQIPNCNDGLHLHELIHHPTEYTCSLPLSLSRFIPETSCPASFRTGFTVTGNCNPQDHAETQQLAFLMCRRAWLEMSKVRCKVRWHWD